MLLITENLEITKNKLHAMLIQKLILNRLKINKLKTETFSLLGMISFGSLNLYFLGISPGLPGFRTIKEESLENVYVNCRECFLAISLSSRRPQCNP